MLGLLVALPKAHSVECSDVPPDSKATCAQRKMWGGCALNWMQHHCCQTCHQCASTCTTTTTTTIACADVAPDSHATCAQRKMWGGCARPWMQNHCCRTCHQCSSKCTHSITTTLPTSTTTGKSVAKRLSVVGASLYQPGFSEPFILRGVNMWFSQKPSENRLLPYDRSLAGAMNKWDRPIANCVRLVMVHWRDDATWHSGHDCYSADESSGYLTKACLDQFDEVVDWATSNGIWAIITPRAALAAGDGTAADGGNMWTNPQIRVEMVAMLQFLAIRYKDADFIAGYEAMSEPRSDNNQAIKQFHQEACHSIWQGDPRAICFVGAGKFYDRYNLNEIIMTNPSGPLVYTGNFFEPRNWIVDGRNDQLQYGSSKLFRCADITKGSHCSNSHMGGNNALYGVNKAYLRQQLQVLLDFRTAQHAPVWINQWGVHAAAGSENERVQFLADVQDLFAEYGLHTTYWIWRRSPGFPSSRFQVYSCTSNTQCTDSRLLLENLASADRSFLV